MYSGGSSERTVYSSPPMVTRTAFLVVAVTPRSSPVLLQEREPGREHLEPLARRLDPVAQRLVLGFELDHPLARFLELRPGDLAPVGLGLGELGLGAERAGANPPAPRSGA